VYICGGGLCSIYVYVVLISILRCKGSFKISPGGDSAVRDIRRLDLG